jgi:hypothetical protein
MLMPEVAAPAGKRPIEKIALAVFYGLLPVAFFVWLYRGALDVWFFADDFAWLSLVGRGYTLHSLLATVFAPVAQGTIRPFSETGYFLLFGSLFGLESLPLRICTFVTMALNLLLVGWIARNITGSLAAGVLAPIFWVANAALVVSVSWNSAYNEILDAFFLLAATTLFIRWGETDERKYWWWQLVVFVLGFGAMEVNVVYPALAAAYAVFAAKPQHRRRLLTSVAPLAAISIGYFIVHRLVAPVSTSGGYAVHLDARMFQGLGIYWRWTLVPGLWVQNGPSPWRERMVMWVATAALLYFLTREVSSRRYIALFFVFWFLIALAPMLPLPDHREGYYLTIPLIGFASLAAWGVTQAWQTRLGWYAKTATLILVLAWIIPMCKAAQSGVKAWVDRSQEAQHLVLAVVSAHQVHPDKTIVLDGMTSALYNEIVGQFAFLPFGVRSVYLTPDSATRIEPEDNPDVFKRLVLDPEILRHAVTHDQVVVYSFLGDHLRNTTRNWQRKSLIPEEIAESEPRRVEVGDSLWAYLLGPEWYPLEPGFRWMPRKATVRLGGPRSPGARLLLAGYCPEKQLQTGPLHLLVSVDGIPLKNAEIDNPETAFRRLFDMPESLIGKASVEVAITVDKVIHDVGGRELGLDFGTIAIGEY